jgi:hypothetical protein
VSKPPWIAAYASNHIVGITEVTAHCNKIHPSGNGTAAQFLGHCARIDQMFLINKAKAPLVGHISAYIPQTKSHSLDKTCQEEQDLVCKMNPCGQASF